MALMHYVPKRHERVPSSIYKDNYGYTINYYQPMINYLDNKRHGIDNVEYPHLPWSYERGLSKYHSSNLVPTYSSDDINRLSYETSNRAQKNLINGRVVIRSPFSVIKTADTARLKKHLNPDSIIERAKRRQVEREEELRLIARREYLKYLRLKSKMDDLKDVHISDDLKRAIRGKSATAISAALLAESEKNIKYRKEEDEIIQQSISRSSRATSESRVSVHSAHIEFVDERLIDNLDYKVSSSLCNVKRQLTNLNAKTSELYSESRSVPSSFNNNNSKIRNINTTNHNNQPYGRSLRSNITNRLSCQRHFYIPLYKLRY